MVMRKTFSTEATRHRPVFFLLFLFFIIYSCLVILFFCLSLLYCSVLPFLFPHFSSVSVSVLFRLGYVHRMITAVSVQGQLKCNDKRVFFKRDRRTTAYGCREVSTSSDDIQVIMAACSASRAKNPILLGY